MSTPELNPLHLRSGANFAPLDPLVAVKNKEKNAKSHYLTDALRERYEHYISLDRETWNDLISVGHMTSLFIQGKQNLKWNGLTKSFYSAPVQKSAPDKNRVTPLMRFYASNLEARYISSNPNVSVIAGREDDKAKQSSRGAKTIVDYHERKLYTNWHNRQEALLLLSFGTQIDRVKWNPGANGFKAYKDIFEDREFPISEGVGQCFACGHSGTGAEYLAASPIAACPNCQSNNAYAEPPSTQILPVKTGQQAVNLGAIELNQLEFPACRWNLRVRAEESSYFIYEQMTSLGAIQRLLGDVDIPEDKGGKNSFGLDVVRNLSLAGLPVNGKSGTDDARSELYRREAKVTEFFLSPEDIADIRVRGDEKTLCGQTLPKDAYYADLFPNGMVAVGLNGMNLLLGVYGETHKEEVITNIWHARQFSGAGQGVSDTVELQKRYNENDSQGFIATKMNATPATAYVEGAIEKEYVQHLGRPDVAFPVNLDAMPNARSINDIISSPRLGQVDAALLQYQSQNLHNMIQLQMQVTNMSNGMPGVNNKTATGAQIGEAYAQSLSAPMLATKVDSRLSKAEKFVRLYVKNVPVEQYFPLKSAYGSSQGVWLSGADLDVDLQYEIVKNSELVRTAYSVREDMDRFFLNVGGATGFVQLKNTDPEFADEVMRVYGVEFENNHFDEAGQICRERFENAKKLHAQFKAIQEQMMRRMPPALTVGGTPELAEETISMQMQPDGSYALPEDGLPDEMPTQPGMAQGEQSGMQPGMSPEQSPEAMMATPTFAPPPAQADAPQSGMPAAAPTDLNALLAEQVVQNLERPISVFEPNHVQKALWFSNFLDTDEGGKLSPELRPVVYALITAHFVAGGQQASAFASMQGQVSLAGEAPGQMADTAKQQYLAQNSPKNNQAK